MRSLLNYSTDVFNQPDGTNKIKEESGQLGRDGIMYLVYLYCSRFYQAVWVKCKVAIIVVFPSRPPG